jgi:hypothetical protein
MDTGDEVLLYTFVGDRLFGTNSKYKDVRTWLADMSKWNLGYGIPTTVPYTLNHVFHLTKMLDGFNVLGFFLTALRNNVKFFFFFINFVSFSGEIRTLSPTLSLFNFKIRSVLLRLLTVLWLIQPR